jgi:2-dehydro-3-deoxyphosphooctonate aldolase (KDO 8-P synthase)
MESAEIVDRVAYKLNKLTKWYKSKGNDIEWVFKVSLDKANRSSINSFRGLGIDKGLEILKDIKKNYGCKILTDIHLPYQAKKVAEIADIVQIPAFLCRQTDLLVAAGETGKIVNIKKGQFLNPEAVKHIAKKIESTGNDMIMFTERGTFFGYNNLVNDMRALKVIKDMGYKVIYDATHSQQRPSAQETTKGNREFIIPMARAATAVGIDGLFAEVHDDIKNAKCDKENALDLSEVYEFINQTYKIWEMLKNYGKRKS